MCPGAAEFQSPGWASLRMPALPCTDSLCLAALRWPVLLAHVCSSVLSCYQWLQVTAA